MKPFTFTDMFDSGPPIRVRARVTLVSTAEGGRARPITARYRPNHNFGAADGREFYIGQLEIDEGDWIHPGETRDLTIIFLHGTGLVDLLHPERRWRLQEGGHLVAMAEVLAVEQTDPGA